MGFTYWNPIISLCFLLRCRNQSTILHFVQFQHFVVRSNQANQSVDQFSLLHEHIHFTHGKLDEISWELLETLKHPVQRCLMQTVSWLALSLVGRFSTCLQKVRTDSIINSLSLITQQYCDHDQLKKTSGGQCLTFCHVKVSELCGVSSGTASSKSWLEQGRLSKLRYCQTGNLRLLKL
jgi:hypothetical protein